MTYFNDWFARHFERSREIPPCMRIGLWDFSARFRSVEMTGLVYAPLWTSCRVILSESEESDCTKRAPNNMRCRQQSDADAIDAMRNNRYSVASLLTAKPKHDIFQHTESLILGIFGGIGRKWKVILLKNFKKIVKNTWFYRNRVLNFNYHIKGKVYALPHTTIVTSATRAVTFGGSV